MSAAAVQLTKQDADEEAASPVDLAGIEHLHLGRRTTASSTASTVHSPAAQLDASPKPKRFSRLKATLARRVSSSSSRHSRDSKSRDSTLASLTPIDLASDDVHAQWEKRATLLARAGPPSPGIQLLGRLDTINGDAPPRLPEMRFDLRPGEVAVPVPVPASRAVPSSPRDAIRARTASQGSQAPVLLSRPVTLGQEAAVALAMERDEGFTKDDLLQEAIKEHEADRLAFAAALFRRAARGEGGLPMGQLMYGLCLRHGWGIAQDETEALAWLRLAASGAAALAESGQAGAITGDLILAIYELGNCFRYGWGVERDPVLARSYFETAANLGDADAMAETAWCYETGFGMEVRKKKENKRKAAYWYRKAEEKSQAIPGNQWIWKPKYDGNPFLVAVEEQQEKEKNKRKSIFRR